MSIIDPKIDVLAGRAPTTTVFCLCSLASKRAHDINDMMRGQRDRAIQLSRRRRDCPAQPTRSRCSMAFSEIARGEVSYDPETIDISQH